MRDGFVRVMAAAPELKVADPVFNAEQIRKMTEAAERERVKILVFPELCLTGVSCGDLFRQEALLSEAQEALFRLAEETADSDVLAAAGLPLRFRGELLNTEVFFTKGRILGICPKTRIGGQGALMEERCFSAGPEEAETVTLFRKNGEAVSVLLGRRLLFVCRSVPGLRIGCVFPEELALPSGLPSGLSEADVLVCPGQAAETAGGRKKRRAMLSEFSARCRAALIYAGPARSESTQDLVWSAHTLIAENGQILKESAPFSGRPSCTEIDTELISAVRRGAALTKPSADGVFRECGFSLTPESVTLTRGYSRFPFRPEDPAERPEYYEEILSIQAAGLLKRLQHTGTSRVLVGVSGGLDSTWALLVSARAFDCLGLDRSRITAVTMPCFGTSERTYRNAQDLSDAIGAELLEINIRDAVRVHFEDIGQDPDRKDTAYENSQARERTQVLMDLANRLGGLVVGTGDLSELALGFATYNGDHMSNYSVNAGVPKTLMRELVRYYGELSGNDGLQRVLLDILDTPVSPELLPAEEGEIAQKTEDLVGPYELHDFFLYHMLRYGFRPSKIFRIAKRAFGDEYGDEVIRKWLGIFLRRFVAQQFKRSCLPDGPGVTEISLSPRGGLMIPSDASAAVFLKELEELTC